MKYIMFYVESKKDPGLNHYAPVIFPNTMIHAAVAKALKKTVTPDPEFEAEVVSAGFIDPYGECYGKSDTLRLSSNIEDTSIIKYYNIHQGRNFGKRSKKK